MLPGSAKQKALLLLINSFHAIDIHMTFNRLGYIRLGYVTLCKIQTCKPFHSSLFWTIPSHKKPSALTGSQRSQLQIRASKKSSLTCINPLNSSKWYSKIQFLPQKKHCSITKTNQLMLSRKIINVYYGTT